MRPVSPIVQVLAGAVGFNGLGNIVSGGVLIVIGIANAPVAMDSRAAAHVRRSCS